MPFCNNCGKEVKETEHFCASCGNPRGVIRLQDGQQNYNSFSRKSFVTVIIFILFFVILGVGITAFFLLTDNNVLTEDAQKGILEPELKDSIEPEKDLDLGIKVANQESEINSKKLLIVNIETLRLRSGPSTNHEILERLSFGSVIEVLKEQNDWLKVITSDGNSGWVHGDYVISNNEYKSRYKEIDLEYVNFQGNTNSNIVNGGYVTKQGDWIYYSNDNDEKSIYKIHVDGNKRTKLNSDRSLYLNVTGNWIFYSNGSDGGKIYRISIDGGDRTKVNDDGSVGLNLVGNWIYYQNADENFKVYKIRTDGSNRTRINNDYSLYTNVYDDWIYYTTLQQQDSIFKVRSDGSGHSLVYQPENGIYGSIIVNNGWIYYSDIYDNRLPGNIYKISTNGTMHSRVTDERAWRSNSIDNYIYYRNISDGKSLYRSRTDGSKPEKISDVSPWDLNVVGDWIYYTNENWDPYRIRIDGSEKQKVK